MGKVAVRTFTMKAFAPGSQANSDYKVEKQSRRHPHTAPVSPVCQEPAAVTSSATPGQSHLNWSRSERLFIIMPRLTAKRVEKRRLFPTQRNACAQYPLRISDKWGGTVLSF